jgi:hypothetical protein
MNIPEEDAVSLTGGVGEEIGDKHSLNETVTPAVANKRAKARRKAVKPMTAVVRRLVSRSPTGSGSQALVLSDQILNLLLGYARKGSRTRNDYYQRDLNWVANVLIRIADGERNPLRPWNE